MKIRRFALMLFACSLALVEGGADAVVPPGRLSITLEMYTDSRTGLTWQQRSGQGLVTWADAMNYCALLELDGGAGWRLPTAKEFLTDIDWTRPTQIGDGAPTWTSTPDAANPNARLCVRWAGGWTLSRIATETASVRCVR
jgi:hypothetical protein